MSRLWLCLRLPQLALDLAHRERGSDSALAIIEQRQVMFASASAQAAGVVPGQSLSTAMALLDELHTQERDTSAEATALEQLAHWCYRFTPYVSRHQVTDTNGKLLSEPDSLLLEIGSCLRLFKGLERLLSLLRRGLQQQQLTPILSLGHTPKASWLLGLVPALNCLDEKATLKAGIHTDHFSHGYFLKRLRPLPLEAMPLSDRQLRRLQQTGFRQLGALLDLPRASLSRRHGQGFAELLDKICGSGDDLQAWLRPPNTFFAERHYLDGLTDVDMLNGPMQELLTELQGFLQQHQYQCQGFQWRFFHFDRSDSRLDIDLSSAQSQSETFLRLSWLKLHDFQIASPIESVQLASRALVASEARSQPLFKELGHQQDNNPHDLLDLLSARLGRERLFRLHTVNEHLPEYRQRLEPLSHDRQLKGANDVAAMTTSSQETTDFPPLPLWLLPDPIAIYRRIEDWQLLSDGYRIDSHWWQQRQHRSYFVARHRGDLHWIFYDVGERKWFIHGYFG